MRLPPGHAWKFWYRSLALVVLPGLLWLAPSAHAGPPLALLHRLLHPAARPAPVPNVAVVAPGEPASVTRYPAPAYPWGWFGAQANRQQVTVSGSYYDNYRDWSFRPTR